MTPRDSDVPADADTGTHQGNPGPEGDDPVSAEDRSRMGDTLDAWLQADAGAGDGDHDAKVR